MLEKYITFNAFWDRKQIFLGTDEITFLPLVFNVFLAQILFDFLMVCFNSLSSKIYLDDECKI